jgi:hypothetical protein
MASYRESPWDWITARRDKELDAETALKAAPKAWRTWVNEGPSCIPSIRYRLQRPPTLTKAQQLPEPGSVDDKVLDEVIAFYDGKKGRFEALAARIMQERLKTHGLHREVRLTRPSGDGGYDMVGRLVRMERSAPA